MDTPRGPSLASALDPWAPETARAFEDVALPAALRHALGATRPDTSAGATPPPAADPRAGDPRLGGRVAVLAGPGVLADGALAPLRAFAARTGLGVANTFGAKGVFRWDAPAHLGTVGLQARDFELLGLATCDVVVVTGADDEEVPPERYALAPVLRWPPARLGELADVMPPRAGVPPRPELFARLAAVARPGYEDGRWPRHPARAVMELKTGLAEGEIVVAQPGPAGLWIGRVFPTEHPGQVVVPPVSRPGVAAALALVAARAGRPVVAVTAEPADAVTRELHERGARDGAAFRLVEWGGDVDLGLTRLLVEAAGPVVAW